MVQQKKDFLQITVVVIALAFICNLLWGSAFPCIKLGYRFFEIQSRDTASQILFAGMRFALAGAMVTVVNCIRAKALVSPKSLSSWKHTVMLSLFQTIIQYILFYIGLAHTTGVKSSIIEASNVFIAILITSLVFRLEKLSLQKIIGCLIGFAGVILINLQGVTLGYSLGDVCIFLSTFSYAISSVLLKLYAKKEDTVLLCGYQFMLGGIVLVVLGILMGGEMTKVTFAGVLMLIYLSFVSAMAYSLWAVLLAHNPVSKILVLGFLNPIFGVVLSAVLLDERQQAFGVRSVLALTLVCIGIFVVYHEKQKVKEASLY